MYLFLLSAILLLDQISKLYFSSHLVPGESLPVIRGVLHFTLVLNTGAAFGIFKSQLLLFILISVSAVCFIVLSLRRSNTSEKWAFILILSGALGNLVDRLRFGYVIDFIDFRVWPVFNVADSAITIGAAWIFINTFLLRPKRN